MAVKANMWSGSENCRVQAQERGYLLKMQSKGIHTQLSQMGWCQQLQEEEKHSTSLSHFQIDGKSKEETPENPRWTNSPTGT